MSVSICNRGRRLTTLLVPDAHGVFPVRIAHGQTVTGLPESVLELRVVKEARARGDFVVQRERAARSSGGKR